MLATQARLKTAWEIPQGLRGALLLGGFLRVFFLFIADNDGGDAIARAANIQKWMSHPSFLSPVAHWGPVYFYLAGTLGFLLKDAELAGRLLSLICGIASIYLVYRLARLLSGQAAATLSAFICALAGLHIGYSTTSSSEMPYLFFLLIGLVGFFEYQTSDNFRPLVWGAICFSVAAGIRYEAWIFFPLLCLLLVWRPANFFRAGLWRGRRGLGLALFVLLGGAWLVSWSGFSWVKWGDPLYAVHLAKTLIQEQSPDSLRPLPYRLSLPMGVLLLGLSPLPFAGALYAIVACRRQALARQFIFLSMAFAVAQYIQFWRGAAVSNARYTLTLFVLATILSGMGISEICFKLGPGVVTRLKKWVFATMVLTQVAILAGGESRVPYNEKLASVSPWLRYPHYLNDAAQSLKSRLKPTDAIIVDSYNWEDNIFVHALGLPLNPDHRVLAGRAADSQKLEDFIRVHHPRFLVYSDKGMLRPYLDLPQQCTQDERVRDMRLDCFYSNATYRVYWIQYSGGPSVSATFTPPSQISCAATPTTIASSPRPAAQPTGRLGESPAHGHFHGGKRYAVGINGGTTGN